MGRVRGAAHLGFLLCEGVRVGACPDRLVAVALQLARVRVTVRGRGRGRSGFRVRVIRSRVGVLTLGVRIGAEHLLYLGARERYGQRLLGEPSER